MSPYTCPMCERTSFADYCCGIDLGTSKRGFMMTPYRVRLVHILKARKGLDDETYRLRLSAQGVDTCKALDRDTFRAFLTGLAALPDKPGWVERPRRSAPQSPRRRARG